jgi:hypothetical protein
MLAVGALFDTFGAASTTRERAASTPTETRDLREIDIDRVRDRSGVRCGAHCGNHG